MDYIKFFNENCRLCGSQRCSGSDEEINECGKNPESDYAKTKAKLGFTNMGAIGGELQVQLWLIQLLIGQIITVKTVCIKEFVSM